MRPDIGGIVVERGLDDTQAELSAKGFQVPARTFEKIEIAVAVAKEICGSVLVEPIQKI